MVNISSVRGTPYRDIFFGSLGDDHFVGRDGDNDFHGYDGDDTFAIGNYGDNYADGGAGSDKIRGNVYDVDIDKFEAASADIPAGTPVASGNFYNWYGELAAKIYFNGNGELVHERRLNTDEPQYNVYQNVEELDWRYHEGDRRDNDDVIGQIIIKVDNVNQTFTYEKIIGSGTNPGDPKFKNENSAQDFVGGYSWDELHMYADGQTMGVTIDNSAGTVSNDGFAIKIPLYRLKVFI